MNKRILTVFLSCAAIFFAAPLVIAQNIDTTTGNQATQVQPKVATADANYLIHEEDVLRMDVWGEQQMSGIQMQVTPDGKINVPYVGEMQAVGLTQAKLQEKIAQELESAEILVKPKVLITLITLHRPTVRVLGAVNRSGEFEFKEGDRVLDAVAQAGYMDNSWLENATLTRVGEAKQIPLNIQKILNGDPSQENFELKKGDVINIPPEEYANKFYVMGQVMRPAMYDLKDKTSVLSAINLAGGPSERASMRATVVIRNKEKIKCDLAKMFDKGDLSQDIPLQAGDVVYVPETGKPNWAKISQILNTITSMTYIRRYGLF